MQDAQCIAGDVSSIMICLQAADEEARLRALKAAKKEKLKKRAITGGAAFLTD